jgi:hypothetical protein
VRIGDAASAAGSIVTPGILDQGPIHQPGANKRL